MTRGGEMNSSRPDFNLSFVPSFVNRWFKEILVRPVNNPFVLSLSKNAFSNHSSFGPAQDERIYIRLTDKILSICRIVTIIRLLVS